MAMAVDLTKVVKPTDFDFTSMWDTAFRDTEPPHVAKNIVAVCKERGNVWAPFNFEEYKENRDRELGPLEQETLDRFVTQGLLTFTDGAYAVTHEFVVAFEEFLEKTHA